MTAASAEAVPATASAVAVPGTGDVPAAVPAAVAAAVAALAEEQWRVAGLLTAACARGAWHARLRPEQRWRLLRLGHFPAYAAELDWTPGEVAGHLRDSARVFAGRIRRIVGQHEPALADFVTDAPERLADYRATPPERMLAELRAAQAGLVQTVAAVRAGELDRAGWHAVDGRTTLAAVLAFLPEHQRDHADQLAALLTP